MAFKFINDRILFSGLTEVNGGGGEWLFFFNIFKACFKPQSKYITDFVSFAPKYNFGVHLSFFTGSFDCRYKSVRLIKRSFIQYTGLFFSSEKQSSLLLCSHINNNIRLKM